MRTSLLARFLFAGALGVSALAACADVPEGASSTSAIARDRSSDDRITYAEIKAELTERSVASIDEMLELFASSDRLRALVTNPVLDEKSFAIHGREVTPDFPRITLHAGNLLMHTLGDPSKDVAQNIEIMEFMPEDRRFHYRVINFAAKGTANWFVDEAEHADFKSMGPAFAGFSECSECHALDATESRPRWPTSPLWQTPYGKVDERIAPGSAEMAGWQSFQKTLADPAKSRRYRALALGRSAVLADGAIAFPDHPNVALSQAISRLNRQRVARIITTWPGYAAHEVAIAGAFFGCDDFESFLPDAERATRRDQLVAHLSTLQNSIFPLMARSEVDPTQLAALLAADTFGSRAVAGRPDMVALLDQEYLKMSPLDTITALEKLARGTGEATLTEMLSRDDTNYDLGGFSANGVDFTGMPVPKVVASFTTEDDAYYPIVARLRYLMDDTVIERPLHWSTATPYSFGFTYRFGDGEGGLLRVMSDEIGPQLLAAHPELDRFTDHVVAPDHLTVDRATYCAALQQASVAALR